MAKKTIKIYPAKRVVQQIGGLTKKNRGHLNAEARNLQTNIKSSGDVPEATGRLKRSVKVQFVGGSNPRFELKTEDYGLYQHDGTRTGVPATKFGDKHIKDERQSWEAAVRERAKR